jgi:hypothetical protein
VKIHYSPGGEQAGSITPRRFEVPVGERALVASALRASERAAQTRVDEATTFLEIPFQTEEDYDICRSSLRYARRSTQVLTIIAADMEGPALLGSQSEVYTEDEGIDLRCVYRNLLGGFCLLADGAADRDATIGAMFNLITYETIPADQPVFHTTALG